MKSNAGFSLIELLVVIVIVSAIVGGVTVAVTRSDVGSLIKEEAIKFQFIMTEAQSHSIETGSELALFFTEHSYQWKKAELQKQEFSDETELVWVESEGSIFQKVKLDDRLNIRLLLDGVETFLVEDPEEEEDAEDLDLEPVIFISNDGESEPSFEYQFGMNDKYYWVLSSDGYHPPGILPYAEEL